MVGWVSMQSSGRLGNVATALSASPLLVLKLQTFHHTATRKEKKERKECSPTEIAVLLFPSSFLDILCFSIIIIAIVIMNIIVLVINSIVLFLFLKF